MGDVDSTARRSPSATRPSPCQVANSRPPFTALLPSRRRFRPGMSRDDFAATMNADDVQAVYTYP